jgi:hypothetical protein
MYFTLIFASLPRNIYTKKKKKKKTDRPYTIFAQKSPFEAEPGSEVAVLVLQRRSCTAGKEMSKVPTPNISCVAALCLNRLHLSRLIKEKEEFFVLIRN